ncbi:carbohydrate ABC transporter membrane protein 1 (CUT1 family) [Alicyclobacillus sacchari]|uniref:Carbohydrate ABC transporter membrane protein 1 (CUT1 family) n=1 Tax=Alicyclobacillus sacchari TaxID=392010 RepID=A0A4R8LBD0_9BACL|nr:ABC transporter permease subunit [Alicyclobacillus sacchari]TDY40242.1 carbohydrate ABC transporter membrane protein 1 (CUT1 family) [Alicyclobacillus sacchari]GMA59373.1 sugar ABC transporter permease [Alicyclobacillus sacchari]
MVNWQLYLLMFLPLAFVIVFNYVPMYGLLMAFQNFDPILGIWHSQWVGFQNFQQWFHNYQFWPLIKNTIALQLFGLVVGFPVPIILAIMLHEVANDKIRRFMQTVLYAPYFISTVVIVGMLFIFVDPQTGLVNHLIVSLGGKPIFFMASPRWFRPLYVFSGVWQGAGFGTILYLAALTGVSPDLLDAALIDGASRMRRIWHISLPTIRPIVIIMLIWSIGDIMAVGPDKAYLMQTPLNLSASQIIPTYVYETGLLNAQYSFGAVVGLFNSVINSVLLIIVNFIAKRLTETSIF